jgi:hypothetical protein
MAENQDSISKPHGPWPSTASFAFVPDHELVRLIGKGRYGEVWLAKSTLTRDVDIVLHLERQNVLRGLEALGKAGYQPAIPERAEAFADPATRERWRRDKNMIVFKLWSEEHQRTPVDIFVHEPFAFAAEMSKAVQLEVCSGVAAPVICLETLLTMKRESGRPQDQIDIAELQRLR